MIYPCFKGKVAVVTGGTRGIGRQVSELLAKSGCSLSLFYRRDRASADAAVKELKGSRVEVNATQVNIADEDEIPRMIAETRNKFGRLDYLVSNAVFGVVKPIGEFTAKRFDISMKTNARAYILLAQAAADMMVPPGTVDDPWEVGDSPLPATKRIVALSSLGSQKYIPGYAAVGTSKAAIETITRYLAVELGPRGIGVNTVSGGLVQTDSMKAFRDNQDWIDDQIKKTPLGRIAEPGDIAKVVVWLLSDQSAWMTGQTVIADGGLSLV